jgi:hypothetical protein
VIKSSVLGPAAVSGHHPLRNNAGTGAAAADAAMAARSAVCRLVIVDEILNRSFANADEFISFHEVELLSLSAQGLT